MDYNINIHKICRVCLEEGALSSIFHTDYTVLPAEMIVFCAKVKVYKNDGLPPVICSNCMYRLGSAYHFKQQCENSDLRLRSYLGILEKGFLGTRDNETNTDEQPAMLSITSQHQRPNNHTITAVVDDDDGGSDSDDYPTTTQQASSKIAAQQFAKNKSRSRYKRKLPEERKKRGPKPQPKVTPTCYECNKTFKCPAQLQLHIRTHTGDRPYECTYCPRRFAQKHNLAIHVRTHTGERPFQCEICSKQFAALGNFQAHKKIHTGIRDQVCPVCQKAFVTAGDLARHMATHTGIKNHHCDVCGKSFTRNRDMMAHKKKIHQQQQQPEALHLHHQQQQQQQDLIHVDNVAIDVAAYKCRECHKLFDSELSLSAHERTHESTGHNIMGGLSTNVMPIAPTAINGTTGAAVMSGLGATSIAQAHGMSTHHHHLHHAHHVLPPPLPPSSMLGHMSVAAAQSTTPTTTHGATLGMMHAHHSHPHAHHLQHHHPHHHPQRLHPF